MLQKQLLDLSNRPFFGRWSLRTLSKAKSMNPKQPTRWRWFRNPKANHLECINPSCNCDLVLLVNFVCTHVRPKAWCCYATCFCSHKIWIGIPDNVCVNCVTNKAVAMQSPVLQLRFWTHLSYRRKTWGSPRRRSKCSKLSRMRAPCEPNCRSVGWLSCQRKINNLGFQR